MSHVCTIFHQMISSYATLKLEFNIFFMLKKKKKSDTVLILVRMAYCASVMGTLFNLLKKILDLITTFFLLIFLIPDFCIL